MEGDGRTVSLRALLDKEPKSSCSSLTLHLRSRFHRLRGREGLWSESALSHTHTHTAEPLNREQRREATAGAPGQKSCPHRWFWLHALSIGTVTGYEVRKQEHEDDEWSIW